jgi:Bacterial dipeptidyl-peptidase Sh3 domain
MAKRSDDAALITGNNGANRPLFSFKESPQVPATAMPIAVPQGQFALSQPAEKLDADHWPVRGDLAHIALVGRVFVPHYAVPMLHLVVADGTQLHRAANIDAAVLTTLSSGASFDVLDMSGGWCWGQMGDGGFVGYIPHTALQSA